MKKKITREELAAWNERKREEELRIEAVKNNLCRMEKVDRKHSSTCQQLQKWDNKMDAEAYLKTFEAAMHEGDFEEADWLPTLRKYLTGRALAIYNEITPYGDISYAQFKAGILERLGLTPQQARRTIWLSKPSW